jgi:probable phosphoglycerate mutase
MRHAPTVWNAEKRIQGQSDSPLTPTGERMALRWGRVLQQQCYKRILTSDLGRALATAQAVNVSLNLPLSAEPRLREQDWGRWTGESIAALRARNPQQLTAAQNRGWDFRPPGGESRRDVWQRGRAALAAAAHRWPGETLLVVTHEGMIKCLAYRLTARRFLPTEAPLLRPFHLHRLRCARAHLATAALNHMALESDPKL